MDEQTDGQTTTTMTSARPLLKYGRLKSINIIGPFHFVDRPKDTSYIVFPVYL